MNTVIKQLMQSIHQNFDCAVCLQLMVEPVILNQCHHNFCHHCLQNLAEYSQETFKCPICRAVYKSSMDLKIDLQIQSTIKKLNPDIFEQRYAAVLKEKHEFSNIPRVKILYGNKHQLVGGPLGSNHQWRMFVDIQLKGYASRFKNAGDLIEKIEFTLHHTFNPPMVTISKPPFSLTRVGWGVFFIPLKIYFKEEFKISPIELGHYLSFDGDGETKILPLEMA